MALIGGGGWLEDAAEAHEVCLAIDRSAAERGRPVHLPLPERA